MLKSQMLYLLEKNPIKPVGFSFYLSELSFYHLDFGGNQDTRGWLQVGQ